MGLVKNEALEEKKRKEKERRATFRSEFKSNLTGESSTGGSGNTAKQGFFRLLIPKARKKRTFHAHSTQ